MAFNTRTFLVRTASAAIFVAVLLFCVWYNYITFIAFFSAVGMAGIYEFNRLAQKLEKTSGNLLGYFLFALLIDAALFISRTNFLTHYKSYLFAAALAFHCFFLVELFVKKKTVFRIPVPLLSFAYVGIPCFCLMLLAGIHNAYTGAELSFTPYKVLGMIYFIWINDTFAYLVGSFLGKHKMYEKVSPGKTWEGTIGGAILCIAASFLVAKLFPQLPTIHWVVISVIVAIVGTLGDLFESMIKRMAGVKDSGAIMPGHGGVLDRFDSLFFATPFVFVYLTAAGL
jgi:phosphatidate cytidylyltransferase